MMIYPECHRCGGDLYEVARIGNLIRVRCDKCALREYWDVTDLVRGWNSGSIPNNGVVFRFCQPCENEVTRRIFQSKEGIVEDFRPVLTITYY